MAFHIAQKLLRKRCTVAVFQIRYIETAFPVCFCNVDDLQMHAGKDWHIRNNRNAESVGHKAGNGLVFINLKDAVRLFSAGKKQLIDHGAQAASPGKQDLRIIQSLGKPDFCPVRKRMIRRNDDHELLPGDRDKVDKGFLVHSGAKCEIVFLIF